MTATFSLHDVTLGYDRHPAVQHLTGSFATGSLTAVVGPNGSGKSTLLKGLIGHLAPLDGRLERGGLHQSDIAYLPQQTEIDRSFPISVMDMVLLGYWRMIGLFRRVSRAQREQAEEALHAVGLDNFGRRPIASLSAGQFQRALFARMLLQNCPVILLDEPFAAIDPRTSADLLKVVVAWHSEGRTIVAVLHDLDQVHKSFPETLVIAREPVAWGATPETLCEEHLLQARQMAGKWDDGAGVYRRGRHSVNMP
ncbi:MAG: ABC transporter ATP-binding protein [Gammaproteobacteria bacterium]|nr:ABC transporter ATP-binding protein [Gammaproteobacteria bacterium]MCY4277996.1 ABC transporter ATP-binding protein [Gammaproteobacteria bacterium]MCY4324314.1 ABC transporter ATP-binding protein [Gammaproteobacteria bacterium]